MRYATGSTPVSRATRPKGQRPGHRCVCRSDLPPVRVQRRQCVRTDQARSMSAKCRTGATHVAISTGSSRPTTVVWLDHLIDCCRCITVEHLSSGRFRLLVDSQFRRANVSSARNQPVDVPTFPEMLAPARPQVLSVAPPLHPLLEDCPRSVGFGRRASTQSRTGHSEANNAEVAPPPSTAFPIRSHMSFIVTFFSCM
jgi:hypothetical protein